MKERISAWIDGELPPAEAETLHAHVEGCDACRALAARMRALGTAVERIEAETSGDFREALFARLEKEEVLPKRRSLFFFSWRWLAVPAAAAAVAWLLSVQGTPPGPGAPTATAPRVTARTAPQPEAAGARARGAGTAEEPPRAPAGTAERSGGSGAVRARLPEGGSAAAALSAEDRDILA